MWKKGKHSVFSFLKLFIIFIKKVIWNLLGWKGSCSRTKVDQEAVRVVLCCLYCRPGIWSFDSVIKGGHQMNGIFPLQVQRVGGSLHLGLICRAAVPRITPWKFLSFLETSERLYSWRIVWLWKAQTERKILLALKWPVRVSPHTLSLFCVSSHKLHSHLFTKKHH